MKKELDLKDPLIEWRNISGRLQRSIRGLSESDLELRGGSDGWSIRETVHHLVEANLIASNIIIAALARDGCDFDWTWVNPDKSWMSRMGYDKATVQPALKTLSFLSRHISGLIANQPQALGRSVRLNDAPGAKRYRMTIEKLLWQEVEHANTHLEDIRYARRKRGVRRGAEAT